MTVRMLKKILSKCDDNDRVILDNGDLEANESNEILYAVTINKANSPIHVPVVILQTRDDIDEDEDLRAFIAHYHKDEGWTDEQIKNELLEIGYTEYEIASTL